MKEMHAVKSMIAMLLVVCIVTGILPVEVFRAAVAYAQEIQSYEPGDFSAVLAAAKERKEGGGASTQGEWQYVVLPEYNYAVITGHTNASAEDLTVPDMLGGADVVGIAEGALADHASLISLMLPGNLYAIADNALPQGIIIKGYNASYAQTYASRNAYAFERVAEFDFRGGVVDYADIRTENFVRVSQYEVRLRALEAERLAVGKRFFLIDPNNAYAVSFYQVAAISDPVDGFVTITCDTPEIEQVLRTYSGENEEMVLSRESLILYDGVELDQGSTWGAAREPSVYLKVPLKIKKELELSEYSKIKISGGFNAEFKATYSGSLFGKKTLEIKQTSSIDISVGYSTGVDTFDLAKEDADGNKLDDLRKKLIKAAKESKGSEEQVWNPKFGTGFVFTYAGIVSGQVVFGAKVSFEGEIEVSVSMKEVTVYSYKDGKCDKTTKSTGTTVTGSAKATVKLGVTCEVNAFLLCVKVFRGELFAGIKGTATIEIQQASGDLEEALNPTPINMLDCVNIVISALIEITVEAGIVDAGAVLGITVPFERKLFELHFHACDKAYGVDPNDPTLAITTGDKDKFHKADACIYDTKTVRMALPFLPESEREIKKVTNVLPGLKMEEPDAPDLSVYDRHFLAWHTDITCNGGSKVDWPYEIKDNVTFYADSARYHDLNYVYTDGTKVTKAERRYAGEPVELPVSGDEREIVQWAVVDSASNRHVIRFLSEGTTEYVMPDENSTLMALCSNDVEVRFYTGIGSQYRRVFAAMDSQLADPAYTDLKKPRFTFSHWEDIDGNEVTFPLTLKERKVNLYAVWDYDDTITAVELSDSDIGERFTFDVPVDNYNVEMSEEEDDDIYGKIFKLSKTTDGWTITGVNTSVSYKDKDGVTQTLKIAPVNLNVPARIKKDGVTLDVTAIGDSAFLNMSTLRAITLNGKIKTLGTSAFHGCTALELIDLVGTYVTALPASMANSCTSLKAVLLPRNLEYMGNYAFANCTSLTKANIMADLGSRVFQNCSGLTTVNIGKHPAHDTCSNISMEIGAYAFQNCTSLTELFIPDSVGLLGEGFVYGCKNLTKLTFDGRPLEITATMMKIGAGSQLNTVIVGEGVETIGDAAFKNDGSYFPLLENVSLPSTIKSIANNAFEGSGVSSLEFYGAGLQLGTYAFANSDVEEVILHSGTVGNYAFYNCDKLKKVTIGTGVRKLGSSVFSGCDNLETVIFEEGVQSIGAYAFSGCKSLTELAFPDSVTSYGNRMIYGCTGLTDLTIGGGCAKLEIKEELIYSSGNMAYYPPFYIGSGAQLRHLEIREGVTEIGKYTFANTTKFSTAATDCAPFTTLETLILPDSLVTIGELAFYKAGMTELTIPENVSSIGQNAFSYSATLKKLVVHGNQLDIGGSAFQYCEALETVALNEGVKRVGNSAFASCTALQTVTMKNGVTTFGDYAFSNCANLKALVFPDSVTSYGKYVISGCKALEELTIGGGCAKLEIKTGLSYASGNLLYYPPFYIGSGAQLKRLEIREGVTEIGKYVFANTNEHSISTSYCSPFTTLETLILPKSLETIGDYAFYQAGMTELTIPENVSSIGSYAFNASANLKNLIVRGDNLVIGNYAFRNCKALETVVLEEGVKSIGSYAFSGCTVLMAIQISDSVKSIGSCAFQDCTSLTELVFPDSVTSYGNRMIQGCTALEDLTIGGGCTVLKAEENPSTAYDGGDISPFYIGTGAKLKRLVIGEGVTEIGAYTFANTSEYGLVNVVNYCYPFATLESVILPESLETIGDYAFYQAGMTELTIPENVSSIGSYAFNASANLKNLIVRGDNLVIGNYAFRNCKALKTVVLEEGVKAIGSYAFENCTALKKLECADSITSYGNRMIQGCTSLEDLTIGGGCAVLKAEENPSTAYDGGDISPFYIGTGAKLKRLVIGEGVTEIGAYTFANTREYGIVNVSNLGLPFTTLESVILPESLTTIGSYNISKWPGVKELHLGANIASLSDSGTRADLTIYTDAYSSQVEAFAAKLGSAYVVRDPSTYPAFTLTRVSSVPATLGALYASDGTMVVTTGLEGEEALLEAGYVVLSEETIAYGDPITEPADPQADGYVFGGWYADAEYTIPWSGGRMPACALTLYARMLPISDVLYAINIPDAGTADARLPQGYSLYALDRIAQEGEVIPPTPVVEGRVFDDWYHDETFTKRWWTLFDRMPEGELILYGRFVPQYDAVFAVNLPADTEYQSAELPSGFSVYQTMAVTEGELFHGPAEPVVSGYVFGGWYEEPTFEHPWNGQRMPEGGVTLYGKMMRLTAGGYYKLTADGYQVKEYVLEEDEASEVYLPAKVDGVPVTSIAAYAFDRDEITTLHLPENLTGFDVNAFDGMSKLKAFVISANNPDYTAKDGVLYSKDMTVLYRYPAGKSSTRFVIPASVTRIDAHAFEDCKNLKSVTFPEGLTQIGEFAFSGCERITSVSLPDGVTMLPSGAFDGCHALTSFTAYGLTKIAKASSEEDETVTPAIPLNANLEVRGPLGKGVLREYCVMTDESGAESMIINYNMRYVTLMINGSLFGKLGAEAGLLLDAQYEYGETDDGTMVVGWYKDAAMSTPWTFATDLMPDADMTLYTTSKPLYEYEDCTITMTETAEDGTESTTDVVGVMLTAYHGTESELVLPRALAGKTVIALGDSFLAGANEDIYEIDIGESVIQIADTALNTTQPYTFYGFVKVEAGSYAEEWALAMGYECEYIKHKLTYVTGGAAMDETTAATGTQVPLRTPVKAGATFAGWYLDEELTTPVTLNENGKFVMPNKDITLYAAWDGEGEVYPFAYEETADGVIVIGYDGSEQVLTIPETVNGVPVTAIGEGAFEGDAVLTRIVLPQSLLTIGERAFAGSKLITADLGGAQDIGASAFEACNGLTYLTMESAQNIGENAFAGCILLKSLPLPEGLSAIADGAFSGCTGVGTVTLPDGVSYVGDGAFENCVGLKTIDLTTAYYVSAQAFDGCTALHTIEASGTYVSDGGVLMTADGSMIVRYPQAKEDTAYVMGDTVTSIAPGAFAGVTKLGEVTVCESLAEIGECAFKGCTALTAFDIPAAAPLYAIAEQTFMGCYNLERVTLSDSVETIGANAFLGCLKLKQIVIPQSVTQISKWAFGATDELLIIGKTGSAAHTFALEQNIMFSDPDAVQAESMSITGDTGVLQRGETLQLRLTIEPAEAAETTKITWRSSDPTIVAVSEGLARAIGGGMATVYAISDNGVEATYDIEVQVAATGISLDPIARMARGQSVQPVARILPLSATNQLVTYTSSDESVFIVDESGMITATGAGIAQLTGITHNGLTAQTDVEVYNAVESIEIVVPDTPLYAVEGLNTLQLAANVLPEDATMKDVLWQSSDVQVAIVDASTGLLKAVAPGDAVITACAQDGSGMLGEKQIQVLARDISEVLLPDQKSVIYDAQAHRPQIVLEMDGLTLAEGKDYLIEMEEAIDAGEYPFTVTGTGLYCGAISGVLSIEPAQTQISYSGGEVYRLGAALSVITVLPQVPYTRELVRVETDGTLTPVDGEVQEPGDYRITIRVEETANYAAAELEKQFTAVDNWLSISCDAVTLAPKQSVQLGIRQLPADTASEKMVFTSSKTSVVSVDEEGRLTANAAGTATITVAPEGGSLALTCIVTVENLESKLNLPGMLKVVSEEAFAGNANADVLGLSEGLTQIDKRAFADMTELKQVHLPESIMQIAENAFEGSEAVVIICPKDSAAQAYAEEMNIPYVYP